MSANNSVIFASLESLDFLHQLLTLLYTFFFFQIRQGVEWRNRVVPPHRSADRHPAGPGLHLGRLGAICGSMPWRQQRSQSGHDPHRRNPRPVWAGAKVSQTLRRRRRAILSRPTARDARDLCSERLESSCHCGHANASDRQTYFCECTDKQTMSRRSSVLEM